MNSLFIEKTHMTKGNMKCASLVAQMLKNLCAMWEIWVLSLVGEDPLERRMATHSNILAWRIPWTEKSSGLQSMGSQRVRHDSMGSQRVRHD